MTTPDGVGDQQDRQERWCRRGSSWILIRIAVHTASALRSWAVTMVPP